jgi:hypothetical protein
MRLRFLFIIVAQLSHTRREWQFAGSILILNRFKLQGNIWQRRAEAYAASGAPARSAEGSGGRQRGRAENGRAMA